MKRYKRVLATLLFAGAMSFGTLPAHGAPLPDNCTKDKGTVTCTEGPGNNQGGVGTSTETQGNTSNTSPAPQDLSTSCNPPSSQGRPCNP